jgi:hypothetical protein
MWRVSAAVVIFQKAAARDTRDASPSHTDRPEDIDLDDELHRSILRCEFEPCFYSLVKWQRSIDLTPGLY